MKGLSCNSGLLHEYSVEQAMDILAEHGYQAIDISLELAPPFIPPPKPHMSSAADAGRRRAVRSYAQQAGIAGLVIDGSVRDAEAIVEIGFPVFCRGLSIKGTNKEQPGQVNEPIVCGGISVNPGDLILGDRDGVVAVSPGRAKDVLAAAEAREAKEEKIRTELKAGKTTVEILGLEPTLNRLGVN